MRAGGGRGEIGQEQAFAVISRSVEVDPSTRPASIVRGSMRIDGNCAQDTEHRLFEFRFDLLPQNFLYSVQLFIEPGKPKTASLRQVRPTGSGAPFPITAPPRDEWFDFEFVVVFAADGKRASVQVTLDGDTSSPPSDTPEISEVLSVSPILGPFAPLSIEDAGCVVDFDNVSVILAEEAP